VRAGLALVRAARTWALAAGRSYVIPDDIKALAEPALAHRLIIKTSSSIHDVLSANVIKELLDSTPIDGIRPTGGPNGPHGPKAIEPAGRGAVSA
jgi:MoxR-like ATPase